MVVPPWFKVPPEGYGGIEVVASLLADGLVLRGHEVVLFTVADSTTKACLFNVFDREMKSYLDETPSNFLTAAMTHTLGSYLEISRQEFDLIHDHTWKEGLCCAAFAGIPVVHTLHGPFDGDNKKFYGLLKNYPGIYFVSISNYQQACFPGLNYLGTVYNGIVFDRYPFPEDKEDYFFYIGRFNSEKAPHLACEAAKKLGKRLILAGKVHEKAEVSYFEQYIRPHLNEDIVFIGEVGHWSEGKMRLLSRSKGYLYPIQWEEPFGITMVEAMACGTPVITFKRGSAPEVVEHGVTGFVVETREEFIEAAGRVEEIDPRNCRERVRKMFRSEVMVADYEQMYMKALSAVRS
ncbi:MAG: glycosyltransferase family 4 protein [Peptococcaceae bacterium]|jgi:glycosyltransferase involved in cell wall biosynthesis|nr:MAG: glycosyltransferase family 4 protein [Peptococcaceae bacterium]